MGGRLVASARRGIAFQIQTGTLLIIDPPIAFAMVPL